MQTLKMCLSCSVTFRSFKGCPSHHLSSIPPPPHASVPYSEISIFLPACPCCQLTSFATDWRFCQKRQPKKQRVRHHFKWTSICHCVQAVGWCVPLCIELARMRGQHQRVHSLLKENLKWEMWSKHHRMLLEETPTQNILKGVSEPVRWLMACLNACALLHVHALNGRRRNGLTALTKCECVRAWDPANSWKTAGADQLLC